MILRRQEDSWSCGVCSLAMCLDVEPDRIRELIGHDGSKVYNPDGANPTWQVEGIGNSELVRAAYNLGHAMIELITLPFLADQETLRPNQPSPQELIDMFPKGTRFLLLVPSIRFEGSYHYVAYESDQEDFYCPVDGVKPMSDLPGTVVINPLLRLP